VLLRLIAFAALFAVSSVASAAPSMAQMKSRCSLGDVQAGPDEIADRAMPLKIEGVQTVTPKQAKCLLDSFGKDIAVIAAMNNDMNLPGAHLVPNAGSGSNDPMVQTNVAAAIDKLTGGDKSKPLLIYCHHYACQLSRNGAIRAVDAGYTSVFWLRDGINGWADAGYEQEDMFKEQKAARAREVAAEAQDRYQSELAQCDKFYLDEDAGDYALLAVQVSVAELPGKWAEYRAKGQKDRRQCLEYVQRSFAERAGMKADIASRLARSDSEVAALYERARNEAETNPLKHFGPWIDAKDLQENSAILQKARGYRGVQQVCGSFDFSLPPVDNRIMAARRAQRKSYWDCLERWRDDDSNYITDIHFESDIEKVAATERFKCSRMKGPNCIPDSQWNAYARVVNEDNLKIVKRAAALHSQKYSLNDELRRLNKWAEDLNNAVDAYNASH